MAGGPAGHTIAIVGGGPLCTYAMERLAALIPLRPAPVKLRVCVFERTGRFGAGRAHSDRQPTTSYMNRVAGQIALAADASTVGSGALLAADKRPSFLAWCAERHACTGDPSFDLGPGDVPTRRVHGLALCDAFDRYRALLAEAGVTVDLYEGEVVDVARAQRRPRYTLQLADGDAVTADQILFVTGHSDNRPAPGSTVEALAKHAALGLGRFVGHAYPLERQLTEVEVPPGSSVAVLGLGLTAIDVFLHLTEGRGGRFVVADETCVPHRLTYVPSGREPDLIVGTSPSGTLVTTRPYNEKLSDPAGLEHTGVFLTVRAVDELRRSAGRPTVFDGETRPQLDFGRDVLPLVALEMAYVYYRTLFGTDYAKEVHRRAKPRYEAFLAGEHPRGARAIAHLLAPVDALFEEVVDYFRGASTSLSASDFAGMGIQEAFRATVLGEHDASVSPWGHSPRVEDHRFDFDACLSPLSADADSDGEAWRRATLDFLDRDLAGAAQGNLRNPTKAACDGVWRDLRFVLSYAADRDGLTPESHERFIRVHLRHYNRLSNGACLPAMQKVRALIEQGLLDVSAGPAPTVAPLPAGGFLVRGSTTQVERMVVGVIEGRSHPFDPLLDESPLYRGLIARGLVRQWERPLSGRTRGFVPGGLDLTPDWHPVGADGSIDRCLTFLGAAAEGVRFFQMSVARPGAGSYILDNVAGWAEEAVAAACPSPAGAPAGVGS